MIGEKPVRQDPNAHVIQDFFHIPPPPNDWIHNLNFGRLLNSEVEIAPAIINGKVVLDQVCFSISTSKNAVNNMRKLIEENPTRKNWTLSIADANKWCECEFCIKETPTDSFLRFVNTIAEKFPDKTFYILAYFATQPPPQTVRPKKNINVIITTIDVPKDDPIQYGNRAEAIKFRNNLKDWIDCVGASRIMVWDYFSNFRHLLMPFPIWHTIGPNIRYYANLGINKFIMQTDGGPGHEFSEFKTRLISELMINPWRNVNRLIVDILIEIYGVHSAPSILKYMQTIEKEQIYGPGWLMNWGDPKEYQCEYLSKSKLQIYKEILSQACTLSQSTPYEMQNKLALLPILYTCIELGLPDIVDYDLFKKICQEYYSKTGETITLEEQHWTPWHEYLHNKGYE